MEQIALNFDDLFEDTNSSQVQVAPVTNKTYEDFDFHKLQVYGGIDCIATLELLEKEFETVLKPGKGHPPIINSYLEIEQPAQEFIIDLEINGMKYSSSVNRWFHHKMEKRIPELDDKIFSYIGKSIDLNSGKVVAEFLYGEKGLIPPYKTKAGEPAVDGQALMTLAGLDPTDNKYITQDPSLQYLADMAMRKDISAVHNTFIKTYIEDFVKIDGRLHPSYNQFGTSSFRITGSEPNLTQLPRPTHGYNVRCCYIVEDGTVFISFDFSSAEVKVLANIAKEPAMLKAISDGLDFHSFSASSMRQIPYAEFVAIIKDTSSKLHKEYKFLRQLSKILTFSILYGSSVKGIASQLNIEVSKAEELVNLYFRTFPKIRDYILASHEYTKRYMLSLTPLGQIKRQYGVMDCFRKTAAYNAALRNSQNVIIQSTTSSIGLATFAELNRRIKPFGAKSVCTVYDSIEIECPIQHAAEVLQIGFDTLNNYPVETFDFLELPIGCEGDIGISWGETKEIKEGVTQLELFGIIENLRVDNAKTFV